MKVRSAILFFLMSVMTGTSSHAAPTDIVFPPIDGSPNLFPASTGFAFGAQIGFTVVQTSSAHRPQLLSFSVTEGRILDQLDLDSDFGSVEGSASRSLIFLKVHDQSGLLILYGQGVDGSQRLSVAKSDRDGRMRKIWSIMSESPGGLVSADSDLAVNFDGSRICWTYYSSGVGEAELHRRDTLDVPAARMPWLVRRSVDGSQAAQHNAPVSSMSRLARRLALIRVDDGTRLASVELRFDSLFSSSVFFDDVNNRVVALAETTAYIFAAGFDRLDPDFTLTPELRLSQVFGQGMSRDGRFLLGYGGYIPDEAGSGVNFYFAYDLQRRTAYELDLKEQLFPFVNGMTFHRETGVLFAPLVLKLTLGAGESLNDGIPRETDVIQLEPDGSLTLAARMSVPKRSADGSRLKLTTDSSVEVSATGALAFIQSDNNRLFTFDTANGEIVSEQLVDRAGRLLSIRLLEPLNRILASDLSTKNLLIVDASTAPAIASVKLKRHRTVIAGRNFLSGAHLLINGVDQGLAKRSAENPGGEIVVDQGKRDFPDGEEFSLEVVNRDGARSAPFVLRR